MTTTIFQDIEAQDLKLGDHIIPGDDWADKSDPGFVIELKACRAVTPHPEEREYEFMKVLVTTTSGRQFLVWSDSLFDASRYLRD